MADPQESALIRRCQAGDAEAYRELVERYQRRVYWIAHNMLNSYDAAQDVAQEAFLRVFRNIGRFDVKKNFYTWLYQITVNLCIDRLRKVSHTRAASLDELGVVEDDPGRGPVESTDRRETKLRVRKALDQLPPKYKAVLTLRDIQGMSCEEMAEILGCTNATARWRLHRARQLFKAVWEGRGVEVGGDDEAEAEGS